MSVLASVTPSDWTEQKFGALFERAQQVGFPELQPLSVFLGDGVVPRSARDDNHNQLGADLSKYQRVQPADIVFNKLRTWQGGFGVSNYEGIVSPAYIVCRPRGAAVEPRFAHHLLRSAPYLAELTRLSKRMPPSQFDISWDEIRTLSLGLPPINDQQRIADFLDDQVSRIDNIIAARRSQQGAIDDEDLASMADALSGGCPEQGGSETGWDWLPRVPATWGVAPVFAFYDAQLGKMLNPERAAGAHPRPYLRNANVHWFDIGVTDLAIMSFEPGERARYRVLPGDLLVCEGGAGVAEAAVWGGEIEECYFQKSLHRVRSRGHLPAEWLMYWLRLAKASGVFESDGNLATIPHLTGEQLREYRIPVPPPGAVPLAALQGSLDANARLRSLLRASVARLEELKRSLITAAVTGEFDVSSADGSRVRV